MTPLSCEEYYDVIVYNKKESQYDNLRLCIYHWMNDFTDRRGIRQSWEQIELENQNIFLNEMYNLFKNNNNINIEDMETLERRLCSLGSISNEYDSIDDDVIEEIRSSWLVIFNTDYLSKKILVDNI